MSAERAGSIVTGLAIILGFQALGGMLQMVFGLQIPGAVLGFFLLWVALSTRWLPLQLIEAAADFLLSHLLLLFTPVVVGVLPYLPHLRTHIVPISLAIAAGTLVTAVVTGCSAQWLLTRKERQANATGEEASASRDPR